MIIPIYGIYRAAPSDKVNQTDVIIYLRFLVSFDICFSSSESSQIPSHNESKASLKIQIKVRVSDMVWYLIRAYCAEIRIVMVKIRKLVCLYSDTEVCNNG